MKLKFIILIILLTILINPIPAAASENPSGADLKQLDIVTMDNRPLYIDRLLYTAFKDIGYQASVEALILQAGYELANSGEKDGVIASTPEMGSLYPNLRQVPVVLDEAVIYAFEKSGTGLDINSWDDLSGLTIGLLTNRIYILSKVPDDVTIIAKETNSLLFEGLTNGEYDVVILALRANETIDLRNDVIEAGKIESFPEYLYLHKDYEYLIPEIKESIEQIFSDGRGQYILNDIRIPEENEKKTVLHLISSNSEVARQETFIEVLRNSIEVDDSIEWYTLAFDSKRFTADPSRMVYFTQLLRQNCVSRNIAAIVVSGDVAMEFVLEYYFLLFRNTPVLFYGVNEVYDDAIKPFGSYFTGIYEDISAEETVSCALSLFPGTTNLYVINDDTTEGKNYRQTIEEQLGNLDSSLEIEYNENASLYSLVGRIKELPRTSVVYVGSYFRDSNGQYYSQSELRRILEKNCELPVITTFSTELGIDAIGGKCADYKSNSMFIADTLKQVLNGESVPSVSAVKPSNLWVFDKNIMDKFGIKEESLPNGSRILNKTPSIWVSDPLFAVAIVALAVMGIVITVGLSMLVYRRNKRKELLKKERELSGKDIKIKEVSERLERIIATAPISFVISISDKIVDLNEDMRKNTGLEIGDKITGIYDNPNQRRVFLERVSRGEILRNEIVKYNFTDGKTHRCFVSISATEYNGEKAVVAWIIDIERDEEKNDQLRIARADLQTILDTMSLAVSIVDTETMNIVYGNNSYLEMLEYESAYDLYGQKVHKALAEVQKNGCTNIEISKRLVMSKEPEACEVQSLSATGKIIDVRIHTTSINYNGRKSVIGIMTDLTAEKEYERMLLNTAEKEKEANQLKSRFLVNMSHEIRTPMNAIIGLTEIELRKEIAKDIRDIYTKINTSAKNLLNIINDILDLSKIEADKIEIHDEEFELESVVESAMLVATPRLDGKDVEFLLDTSIDLPRFLIGDKTRLWQILKNFLDNAAKFTEHGKIILSIHVVAEASDENQVYISFTIKDTGIGISDEQMERLFKPYEQIYSEAQKRYTGTGLGMAISKQFCTLMGGEMQIESLLGKGTSICMKIPFKRSGNAETGFSAVKYPELSGARILAVDDDELSLSIMSELLTNAGASCFLARSGEEAIKIIFEFRDMGKSFDIILLDYLMDGINGLETARQIQAGLSVAPKLLMVTSYQRLLLKKELDKYNIDDVIEKPFVPSHFLNKIRMFLTSVSVIEEENDELPQFSNVTVLLCEDYAINREVAIGMFSEFGIETVVAENGQIGVDILMTGETDFDIIFMDLQMPVMDGYGATRQIRADSRFDNIPIISLTADAMKEVVNKCREVGMNDHLAKPIEFDSLEEAFVKWLPDEKRVYKSKVEGPPIIEVTPRKEMKDSSKNDALARFGGKLDLYEKALREFAKDLPHEWPSFDDAISDIEETKRNVHKIKGVAGNLSEADIYQYASEFESSLRIDRPNRGKYDLLVTACSVFKEKKAAESASSETDMPFGTIEEFTQNMNLLKEALQEYDLKKCSKAADILKAKVWPLDDSDKDILGRLYDLVENYDYDSALDALKEMQNG